MEGEDDTKYEEVLGIHISEAYKRIRGDVANVEWRSLVCHSVACPKQVFTSWVALHGRLRTEDVLLKWDMQITGDCVLCGCHLETLPHLF